MGAEHPVELADYLTEAAFWRKLGVPADHRPLDRWPLRKIKRYLIVMEEVAKREEFEMKRARAEAEAAAKAQSRGPMGRR